jgi:hypothetical protein
MPENSLKNRAEALARAIAEFECSGDPIEQLELSRLLAELAEVRATLAERESDASSSDD